MILGGAALNRRYVEQDLRAIYKGKLFYGEDAFDGLRIMDELAARKKLERVGSAALKGVVEATRIVTITEKGTLESADHRDYVCKVRSGNPLSKNGKALPDRSPSLPKSPDIPLPPFLGSRASAPTSTCARSSATSTN